LVELASASNPARLEFPSSSGATPTEGPGKVRSMSSSELAQRAAQSRAELHRAEGAAQGSRAIKPVRRLAQRPLSAVKSAEVV
jgi:hypothetical protein